jgi:hypothetical protein
MALGIGYGLPFIAQHGTNPYKTQWSSAREGAKGAGATVEDENAGVGSCLVARGQEVYTDGLPFTPSLLIVPQFYKEGNLYQDVPPFVAEDTTMRFTVTRATTATRVNSSGLIESVASGVPRIDWQGQSCPALLVEASGQNLVPSGTTFNSETGVQYSGIIDSPAVNISGTLITKNEASGTIRYGNQTCSTSALASGTTYVISRFFKYNGVDFTTTMEFNNSLQWGGISWSQSITLSAASGVTLGTSTNCTGSIDNFGNGWYRVSARITTGATISGGTPVSYLMRLPAALSTGQGFLTACPQLETGAVATTYIPTTTAAVTRNADQISASGALVSGLIGQTEGTLYAEVDVKQLVGAVAKTFVDIGIASNRIFIGFTSLASNTIRLQIDTSDGSARADIRSAVSSAGILKIAAAYKSADCALYVNGVSGTVTNNNSFTFSALNAISLGKTLSDTAFLNDRIRAAALYTTRLSNDQLAELTRL